MIQIIAVLCLFPGILIAQVTHREATPEERKAILTTIKEDDLKALGTSYSMEAERSILRKALLKQAVASGKLDQGQMVGYIQKLTDHGLNEEQRNRELEYLSNKYFSELQLRNLKQVLSIEKQKGYEKKFNELQIRNEEGKLTHEELDKEISILNLEITNSEVTKDNAAKAEQLKKSLLTAANGKKFVPRPFSVNTNQFSPVSIMVPQGFALKEFKAEENLCLKTSEIPLGAQLEQLSEITLNGGKKEKPLIHQIYFAWGWNRNYHSDTDVKFTTPDGTFTVHNTHSNDRPSPFDPKIYFNPSTLSIPQYNMELGVMFNGKWGMELKQDHMKLVFDNSRPYEITGDYSHQVVIDNDHPTSEWDQQIPVDFSVAKAKKDATWLNFEHSDGYNYASLGAVYNQSLFQTKNEKFKIDSRFGAGAGLMIPKTKVMFHQDRQWNHVGLDNKFHIAGGGVHAEAKVRFTFWNSIFLQAATRGTYIKVKDALVDGTESRMEHVQPIASVQFMGQIGYVHTFKKKENRKQE